MSVNYVLGEVQTDPAPRWTRHAVTADAMPRSWAHAACEAAPRVWVHGGMPFPGLAAEPATTCPECLRLALRAAAEAVTERRLKPVPSPWRALRRRAT